VIDGATAAVVTVKMAALLVTAPAELLTTTVKRDPLSDIVTGRVLYVAEVAPLMTAPFFSHW
jgi:hypothetical protein